MNVIVKPIMYLLFCLALLSFINILLIFITVNQTSIVLNEAVYIVETYGNNTEEINSNINELEEKYNNKYIIELQNLENQEYTQSTNVIVTTQYDYIARNHSIDISKNQVVMNKQL